MKEEVKIKIKRFFFHKTIKIYLKNGNSSLKNQTNSKK